MPPTSSRVRASTTLSAQITWNLRATSLGAITDISIGDEFARTAHHGLWQVRSRAYEYLQAQSPSCSDPADGKRDIGGERRHIKLQPAVRIRLPFRCLPAGVGTPGDDAIGAASQPGQLQGSRNRHSAGTKHTVSPDRVAANQPDHCLGIVAAGDSKLAGRPPNQKYFSRRGTSRSQASSVRNVGEIAPSHRMYRCRACDILLPRIPLGETMQRDDDQRGSA